MNATRSTIRDYLQVIFRRKAVIAMVLAAMTVTVLTGLELKTPAYESKVTMFILARKQVDSFYYKDAPDMRVNSPTLTQSEIVKSNPVLERVVKRLGLDQTPADYEKKFASPLKGLLIDMRNRADLRKLAGRSEEEQKKILFRRAVEALKKRVKVEPVRDTDLFTVTVSDFDAARAARTANAVSRSYCIFDLEQQMAELQQKYGDKNLFVIQLKDNIVKMEDELTSDTLSNIDAIGPASVKIIEQANEAVEPEGKSKKTMLAFAVLMGLALGVIMAFVIDGFDTTIKSGRELESQLKIQFLGFVPRRMTSVSRLYAGLALGMGWLAGIAVALLATRFFVSGTGDLDGSNAFVNAVNRLSEPFLQASGMGLLPRGEGFDRRAVFAVVIILAALAVLARVLVLCSRRSPQAKSMIIRGKTPGRYASSCYDLGEQMAQALRTSGKKSVLFTSSVSGEGTSPLVADLGSVFATRPGTRVLLIDANLRKPALHRLLGLDNGAGLGELLSGEAKLSDVVREASGQLSVITAGRQDAVLTSGLFDSDAMRLLMERVHDGFDLVLVDCACLQSFQDAGILSSYVDAVVLAVREGKAKVEVISHVLAGLERKKAPLLGGVLTNRTFSVPRFLYERA